MFARIERISLVQAKSSKGFIPFSTCFSALRGVHTSDKNMLKSHAIHPLKRGKLYFHLRIVYIGQIFWQKNTRKSDCGSTKAFLL